MLRSSNTRRSACLQGFNPQCDDPGPAIFDRVVAAIRNNVPSLAHHSRFELEVMFGDLRVDISEIVDAIPSSSAED
jgi:hypothetical protein